MSTPPEPPVDPWATPQPGSGGARPPYGSPDQPGGWNPPVGPPPPRPTTGGEAYFDPAGPYFDPAGAPAGDPIAGPSGGQGGPYPTPSGQYGQYGQPYATGAPSSSGNGLGTAALVLGILAVLLGIFLIGAVFGAVAIALGVFGRSRARRGRATNGGVALSGALLGLLGVLIAAAITATLLAVFAGPISDFRRCVSQAGGDSASQQVCNDELRRRLEDRFR